VVVEEAVVLVLAPLRVPRQLDHLDDARRLLESASTPSLGRHRLIHASIFEASTNTTASSKTQHQPRQPLEVLPELVAEEADTADTADTLVVVAIKQQQVQAAMAASCKLHRSS
jgi:septal ring-binding cell division protein DamX